MIRLRTLLAAVGIAGVALLAAPGSAGAHHPLVVGSVDCSDDGWSVDWTVRPDANRPGLTWSIVSPAGYSPAGSQPAGSGSSFTRTTTHGFDVVSVTETVTARWSNGATATRSATVSRPQDCTAPTTTTTTTSTTSSTTSTSVPSSSTTTTSSSSTLPSSTLPSSTTVAPTTTVCSTGVVDDGVCQPTGTGPTTTTVAVGPPPTPPSLPPAVRQPIPQPVAPTDQLPETGVGDSLVGWAALLVSAGGMLVLLTRRPEPVRVRS